MIRKFLDELYEKAIDEYNKIEYILSIANAYSSYSDSCAQADELLKRFLMERLPGCVFGDYINVYSYISLSDGIVEKFMEYVKSINCDWRGHEREHIKAICDLLEHENVKSYAYEWWSRIDIAKESQRVECLKALFDYLHHLRAGAVQITYNDNLILAYVEGCTLSAKEVLLLTQSRDKRAYIMNPVYGVAKSISLYESTGYRFTIRKEAIKPEWLHSNTMESKPGLTIILTLHDGINGDELINNFRMIYMSHELLNNVSFYKDEDTLHKIKLTHMYGCNNYPILRYDDRVQYDMTDSNVVTVAEAVMDTISTEKLQEFVKLSDISPEDTGVEYILSVDDNDFCIMNTTSDVADEWKPMDLTKIDEWVNAGFVIEGVTKDKYTDLLKMCCEINPQDSDFNKEEYLKEYIDILPPAAVADCVTKEDCDSLLNSVGLQLPRG